jgi:hypothetical protein
MKNYRINNFRMAGYAALAAGLINLRYQWGSDVNKSLVLIIPGALLLLSSLTTPGKNWMQTKSSTAVVGSIGSLLLIYSFII